MPKRDIRQLKAAYRKAVRAYADAKPESPEEYEADGRMRAFTDAIETFVFLGKKYGVSDVAVRSVCLGVTWWKETGVTRAFTSSMLKKKNARKDKAMSILSKSNSKESPNGR